MTSKLAATINLGPNEGFTGFGPLGNIASEAEGPNKFAQVISTTIGVITVVAIIWFTIQLLLGAVAIISGGGDKSKLEGARGKITSAIIGLVVVIAGIFLVSLIGALLGLPNILDVGSMILLLKPQ